MDSKKIKFKKTKYLFNINIKTEINKNEKDLVNKKNQKKFAMKNSQSSKKKSEGKLTLCF